MPSRVVSAVSFSMLLPTFYVPLLQTLHLESLLLRLLLTLKILPQASTCYQTSTLYMQLVNIENQTITNESSILNKSGRQSSFRKKSSLLSHKQEAKEAYPNNPQGNIMKWLKNACVENTHLLPIKPVAKKLPELSGKGVTTII
nr:hypothetical protein [Tanacetum cinerariifolium]